MSDPSTSDPEQPLAGVRVVELARVLSGPYATMLLADLGAEVIKVEHPERSDDTRAWGPPDAAGESAYYLSVNRGKRDLAVDMKDPDGLAAVRDLCAGADVVIENFRPGVATRLGVGYDDIRSRNPSVVYCSVSAFGEGREPADRPGFDAVLQAETGFMHITGEVDGVPSKVGVAITDVLTALNCAVAINAALFRRARTGHGEHVRVSLLESALSGMVNVAQSALVSGEEARRYGNAHASVVPYETLAAADGWLTVAVGNDTQFRKLCDVLSRDDLAGDPRFATNPDRVHNRGVLIDELSATLRARPAQEWTDALMTAGVPVGKIRGVLEAMGAAAESGTPATFTVDHPTAGPLDQVRPGFSGTGDGATWTTTPPPRLGEHTRAILTELGLPPEHVAELEKRGVVQQAPPAPAGTRPDRRPD